MLVEFEQNRMIQTTQDLELFDQKKKKGGVTDYRYHDFPTTEFSYFLTIDTRQYELSN